MLIKIKTKKTKNKVEALTLQKKSRCFITQTSPKPFMFPDTDAISLFVYRSFQI